MFERFSKEARQIVVLAQEDARHLRHHYIGTEHLLLSLLRQNEGTAAEALRSLDTADLRRRIIEIVGSPDDELDSRALATLGIDLDEVKRATEASFGPGALDSARPMPSGHIPFTKRAKKVLELSLREAVRLGHDHIGSGHVLLGLIREGEGIAALVLKAAGADLDALRDEVIRHIGAEAA